MSNNLIFNGKNFDLDWRTNWGDNIAYDLITNLSKKNIPMDLVFWLSRGMTRNGKIISIGSVMDHVLPNDLVWGTGMIDQGSIRNKPKRVFAVRGPLTRHELISRGIECPIVYGDPALLIQKVHKLPTNQTYEWGIIPHYIEYEDPISLQNIKRLESLGCKIINICQSNSDFLEDLSQVKKVLSSSLHGLIVADAYGIPNARINFSNRLIGSHFKFVDYSMSVHRKIEWGYQIKSNLTLKDLEKIKLNDKIYFNEQLLLEHAPWNYKEWEELVEDFRTNENNHT